MIYMNVPDQYVIVIDGKCGMGMSMMAHRMEEQMKCVWFNDSLNQFKEVKKNGTNRLKRRR